MSYRQKYIKYKSKYLQAKKIHGGMEGNVEEQEPKLCYPPDTDYNDFFLNEYNYYIVIRYGFITTIRTKIDNKEDIINHFLESGPFPPEKIKKLHNFEEAKALWQQIKHLNRSEIAGHWCKIEEDMNILMQNLDLE
tara:strand:+ start:880 stop:1287 length:408 start_codon:yes stop_codon:yes gene_type:complete